MERRSAVRVGSVLLELCGVLQQVFICQFSGSHWPFLLKTSHGISWHCPGLDTTSHTNALASLFVYVWYTKSYDLQRYLSPKEVVTVKKYTCSVVCFEVWASLDQFAESGFLCVCSAAQAYNSSLCRQSRTMCFAVVLWCCGVEVMTEGESLPGVHVTLSLWLFLSYCFPQPFSSSVCLHSSLALNLNAIFTCFSVTFASLSI